MPLDLTQPYGRINNDALGRVYEQDGFIYKGDGTVWTPPAEYEQGVARMKVSSSSGEVTGIVGPDGTVATVGGAFTDLTDAPATYAGHAGQLAYVNAGETGLEFTGKLFWGEGSQQLYIQDNEAGPARFAVSSVDTLNVLTPLATANVGAVFEGGVPIITKELYCDDKEGNSTDLLVTVTPTLLEVAFNGPSLKLTGLSVAASGASTITVGGTVRTLQYALKFNIGGVDVYFPGYATA